MQLSVLSEMLKWVTDDVSPLFSYIVKYVKPAFSNFYSRECYRIKLPSLVEAVVFAMDEAYNLELELCQW